MVVRRVVMRARTVVFFKGVVEASEGLAAVYAERVRELDSFLDDLCAELCALRPREPA
jgi:hypothetical protein